MTDGTSSTSNVAAATGHRSGAIDGTRCAGRSGTLTSHTASTTRDVKHDGTLLYFRIEYDAANTFVISYSPDGVTYIVIESLSKTMTPTHVGLAWSTHGTNSNINIATFDYIRKVA